MVFGLFLFPFFSMFFFKQEIIVVLYGENGKVSPEIWKIWIFISWTCQLYLDLVFLYYYNLNIAVAHQFSIWNIIDRIKSRISLHTDRQTDAIKMGEPPGFKNKPLWRKMFVTKLEKTRLSSYSFIFRFSRRFGHDVNYINTAILLIL